MFFASFLMINLLHVLLAEKISDMRLCADKNCKTMISKARALARYKQLDPAFLSFERGDLILVYSKEAGSRMDLWGGELNGKKGYFPRSFVKETDVIIPNPADQVETEPHIPIEERVLGKAVSPKGTSNVGQNMDITQQQIVTKELPEQNKDTEIQKQEQPGLEDKIHQPMQKTKPDNVQKTENINQQEVPQKVDLVNAQVGSKQDEVIGDETDLGEMEDSGLEEDNKKTTDTEVHKDATAVIDHKHNNALDVKDKVKEMVLARADDQIPDDKSVAEKNTIEHDSDIGQGQAVMIDDTEISEEQPEEGSLFSSIVQEDEPGKKIQIDVKSSEYITTHPLGGINNQNIGINPVVKDHDITNPSGIVQEPTKETLKQLNVEHDISEDILTSKDTHKQATEGIHKQSSEGIHKQSDVIQDIPKSDIFKSDQGKTTKTDQYVEENAVTHDKDRTINYIDELNYHQSQVDNEIGNVKTEMENRITEMGNVNREMRNVNITLGNWSKENENGNKENEIKINTIDQRIKDHILNTETDNDHSNQMNNLDAKLFHNETDSAVENLPSNSIDTIAQTLSDNPNNVKTYENLDKETEKREFINVTDLEAEKIDDRDSESSTKTSIQPEAVLNPFGKAEHEKTIEPEGIHIHDDNKGHENERVDGTESVDMNESVNSDQDKMSENNSLIVKSRDEKESSAETKNSFEETAIDVDDDETELVSESSDKHVPNALEEKPAVEPESTFKNETHSAHVHDVETVVSPAKEVENDVKEESKPAHSIDEEKISVDDSLISATDGETTQEKFDSRIKIDNEYDNVKAEKPIDSDIELKFHNYKQSEIGDEHEHLHDAKEMNLKHINTIQDVDHVEKVAPLDESNSIYEGTTLFSSSGASNTILSSSNVVTNVRLNDKTSEDGMLKSLKEDGTFRLIPSSAKQFKSGVNILASGLPDSIIKETDALSESYSLTNDNVKINISETVDDSTRVLVDEAVDKIAKDALHYDIKELPSEKTHKNTFTDSRIETSQVSATVVPTKPWAELSRAASHNAFVIDGTTFPSEYFGDEETKAHKVADPNTFKAETLEKTIGDKIMPTSLHETSGNADETVVSKFQTMSYASSFSDGESHKKIDYDINFTESLVESTDEVNVQPSETIKDAILTPEETTDSAQDLGTSFKFVSNINDDTKTVPIDTITTAMEMEIQLNNETVASNNAQEQIQPSLDQNLYKTMNFISRKPLSAEHAKTDSQDRKTVIQDQSQINMGQMHDDVDINNNPSVMLSRKVPDSNLDEEIKSSSKGIMTMVEPFLKSLIELLPPSIQSILEQEPLGLSPAWSILVFMISTIFLIAISCLCCICKKKNPERKDPLVIIRDLEEQLFIVTKEKENLEDDLQVKTETIEELRHEVDVQQSSSGSVEADLKVVMLQNEALKKQVLGLQKEVSDYKEELTELRQQNTQQLAKLDQYTSEVQSQDNRAKNAETALQKMLQSFTEKDEVVKITMSQVETLTDQIKHLETRKKQLEDENEDWSEKAKDLTEQVKQYSSDTRRMQEEMAFKENELEVLRDCFLQVKAFQGEDEIKNESDESPDLSEKLKQMMDVSMVNASLRAVEEEKEVLQNRLLIEVESRKEMEDQIQMLKRKIEGNQMDKMKAERQCQDAQTKLEVLSKYFKEKETELTRQLGEQEVLKNQNLHKLQSSDSITQELVKENEVYRQQIEDFKTEISKAERDFRSQIAANEKKAHENWLASRAAERELKESRHECGMLRQKLTDLERKLIQGPPPGLIRPITHRGMPPPGMINGLPPPPERPGSRGSVQGHVTPRIRDDDYRPTPTGHPADRRLPPGPPGPRHAIPLDAMSPPPFIRPPFPPHHRSPPPFDRYPPPVLLRGGPRPPFARLPPPHLRSPPIGDGVIDLDDTGESRHGQVPHNHMQQQGSRDRGPMR